MRRTTQRIEILLGKDKKPTIKRRPLGQNLQKLTLAEERIVLLFPGDDYSASAEIKAIDVWRYRKDKTKDWVWRWNLARRNPHAKKHFTITPLPYGAVCLVNTNTDTDQEDLHFGVTVVDGNNTYTVDPELVIPKRTYPLIPGSLKPKRRPKGRR